jgi:hypothetical protein
MIELAMIGLRGVRPFRTPVDRCGAEVRAQARARA